MKKLLSLVFMSALTLGAGKAFAAPESVDEVNGLLEGELSAVETYKQAMEKVKAPELDKALKNHEAAVNDLRAQVKSLGGTPVESSGVWGTWTEAVTGAAKTIGRETALKALKEGEKHGVDEYEEALKDDDVPVVAKNLIKDKLLPQQQEHINSLDKLIAKM
jgi:uncharacterized protein (TIGR02284 family)